MRRMERGVSSVEWNGAAEEGVFTIIVSLASTRLVLVLISEFT